MSLFPRPCHAGKKTHAGLSEGTGGNSRDSRIGFAPDASSFARLWQTIQRRVMLASRMLCESAWLLLGAREVRRCDRRGLG